MKRPAKRPVWIAPPGPVAPGLKIGLLGGSFNPAHAGHLRISEVAMKRLGLDYVWWLVSPQNPLKAKSGMATLRKRVHYADETIAGHRRLLAIDIEAAFGTRYTVDTLTKLQRRFPRVHFVWIMGSDSLENFRRWKRWPEIVARVPIAVMVRPGSVLAGLHAQPALRFAKARRSDLKDFARAAAPAIAMIDLPRSPLSSTSIRAACRHGEMLVSAIPA